MCALKTILIVMLVDIHDFISMYGWLIIRCYEYCHNAVVEYSHESSSNDTDDHLFSVSVFLHYGV